MVALIALSLPGAHPCAANPLNEVRTVALGDDVPMGWNKLGTVSGLLGDDWFSRRTTHCLCFARQKDVSYVQPIVDGLEDSWQVNAAFLGLRPTQTLEFYFCPMDQAAHLQPKFKERLRGNDRFAGVALSGTNIMCVNLGSARFSQPYPPWKLAEVCRHEMDHMFAFEVRGPDRLNSWGWLYEALAHTIENTAKPASARLDLPAMKAYMAGYKAVDANWKNLIDERNNNELEQYRDYDKLLVSIIFFLQDKYGKDAIAHLIANCRGRDLEEAFKLTYGTGVQGLEETWKSYYGIH
jgi:hypothetical protein